MKEVVITSKVVGRGGGSTPVRAGQGSQVDLSDYLLKAIWDEAWELRTDSNGQDYMFGKLPIVTQYGITMYADDSVDVGTIYDGLPIDGTTIYWENGVLKSLGGGTANAVAWGNITDKPSWIGSDKPVYTMGSLSNVGSWADSVADVDRIMYQAAGSSNWVAKSLSSIGGGGGSFSGGVITGSGYNVLVVNRTDRNRPTIGFQYNGSLYGYFGFANADYPVFISSVGDAHQLLHANNYSQYALPLSGGTVTGKLTISGDNSGSRATIHLVSVTNVPNDLYFGSNGILHWSLTSRDTNEGNLFALYNAFSTYDYVFTVNKDSVFNFNYNPTVKGSTIWHSGNDGAGSGLDADLLDGQQGSWYQNNAIAFSDCAPVAYNNVDANVGTSGMLFNYGSYSYWKNAPIDMYYGQILTLRNYKYGTILAGQLAWDIIHNSTTDTTRYLWWRATDQGDWIEAKWHQIAFTDSNVASATKLQTARTIWGQSFDGTGNVDGKIKLTSWDSDGTALRFENSSADDGLISMYTYPGNAYTFGQTTNRFVIRHNVNGDIFNIVNGNVGIGYTSPTHKLHVLSSGTHTVAKFEAYSAQSVIAFAKANGISWSEGVGIKENGDSFGWWTTTGQRCAASLDVSGNFWVNGGITMYSDKRKKTILNHVELSLKQIANAPLIEHYYNGDEKKTTHVGSIAQYWASMNDWFCKLDSEGYYTMEIQNAALASAISVARELDRYESKTDKKIKQLKKRICQLEDELERLKSA